MFARPTATATPGPALSIRAASRLDPLRQMLSRPWTLPAATAGLLAGAILLFVVATGDPHAGAPILKATIQGAAHDGPGAPLRPSAGGPQTPNLTTLLPGQDVGMAGATDPLTAQIAGGPGAGQAVITLPQGASLGGGAVTALAPPAKPKGPPLPPAPIAGLTVQGPGGLLPVVARDGRTPFQAYARPFQPNGRPKIALVIGALGLNAAATRAAIEKLPPEITLSFTPYADGLQGWIDLARANGHEVMIELPMEPLDYPASDPGPYTLMAGASPAEITKKLEWLLGRATGYFAVTNYMGGRFLASDPAMNALIAALRSRGVGFVDDGQAGRRGGSGAPRASADTVIDDQLSAEGIDQQLVKLEGAASQHGQALGAGFAYGVTLDKVTRWAATLQNRGYQLAPASAVMRK